MPVAVLMTPFAEWLEAELDAREINRAQLAAFANIPGPTVHSWFRDGRIPGPQHCYKLADYLKLPRALVMQKAGHGAPGADIAEPELPGWLTQVLEKLDPDELKVVDATARGLLRLREERAASYEASPAEGREPPRQP